MSEVGKWAARRVPLWRLFGRDGNLHKTKRRRRTAADVDADPRAGNQNSLC